jgi:tetratricopeptide (TPR) repeat protein
MQRLLAPFFCALTLVPLSGAESFLAAPFSNRSNDSKLDWIGESISEAIREGAESVGLGTVTREDREEAIKKLSLRQSGQLSLASIIKIAETTGASRAIYGQFELLPGAEKTGSRGSLRITARFFDLGKVRQSVETAEIGAIEDLPVLEADLAWHLMRSVPGSRVVAREAFLHKNRAVKVNALEYYIRGLMSGTKLLQHRYFTQAARLDPSFAHPNFHLGRMQWEAERYRDAAAWLEKVPEDYAQYLEASFMLAMSRYESSEYEAARRVLEKIEPKLPVAEVWNNLGAALARLGRSESIQLFRRAHEADPSDPDYQFNLGYAMWRMRDFANAADRFRAVLDRSPEDQDAIHLLGRCLASSGPRPGDIRAEGLERLKDGYTEPARPDVKY